ncbi:MAG: hypothetical protein GC151_08345 [Betaproteobacteria bacterium]|nr:hypothetical protein [Betaproteobacteria bacterium]
MGHRRALVNRMSSLRDISGILDAMKNLALVEVRRIEGYIAAQRAASSVMRASLQDLLASRPGRPALRTPETEVLIAIGAERGFCGDFQARVAESVRTLAAASAVPPSLVLVGSWPEPPLAGVETRVIGGASVAEDVATVLDELVDTLAHLFAGALHAPPAGLRLVYLDGEGPRIHRLLPFEPDTPSSSARRAVDTLLPCDVLVTAVTRQLLEALLQTALLDSLLAENHQRLDHMDSAIRKLDEKLDELDRRQKRLRQEEITQEIEIILLSSRLLDDASNVRT